MTNPLSTPIKDSLYPTKEKAESALRRGGWTEIYGGWWLRKTKLESLAKVAAIISFEGQWKILIEIKGE